MRTFTLPLGRSRIGLLRVRIAGVDNTCTVISMKILVPYDFVMMSALNASNPWNQYNPIGPISLEYFLCHLGRSLVCNICVLSPQALHMCRLLPRLLGSVSLLLYNGSCSAVVSPDLLEFGLCKPNLTLSSLGASNVAKITCTEYRMIWLIEKKLNLH